MCSLHDLKNNITKHFKLLDKVLTTQHQSCSYIFSFLTVKYQLKFSHNILMCVKKCLIINNSIFVDSSVLAGECKLTILMYLQCTCVEYNCHTTYDEHCANITNQESAFIRLNLQVYKTVNCD